MRKIKNTHTFLSNKFFNSDYWFLHMHLQTYESLVTIIEEKVAIDAIELIKNTQLQDSCSCKLLLIYLTI